MVFVIQQWIFAILAVALFALELWALVNALRFRADAYTAAGKRTKAFWGVLTGVAALLGFLSLPYPIGGGQSRMLFMLIGVVIAGVFLADVYPALKSVMRNAQGPRRR
ncbi:DUF2516 family protein [Brachybacterium sp. JHP9]|uniref:DUF2516 family protein n=1 Tax=Brachybacterium equifaecis TaxID=2910770 RepID=A0ABT0QZE1_9MICO|nr:DUF2516 family protein [Brachybacterium equifaecis]MCL6422404.1 DUF2516 family protein [Brachybacterium equifaecis]